MLPQLWICLSSSIVYSKLNSNSQWVSSLSSSRTDSKWKQAIHNLFNGTNIFQSWIQQKWSQHQLKPLQIELQIRSLQETWWTIVYYCWYKFVWFPTIYSRCANKSDQKGGGGEWSITRFGGDALMQTKDLGWNVILQLITERIKPVEKAFLLTSKVIGCGQQPNTHDLETNWYMSWNWLDPNEKNHLSWWWREKKVDLTRSIYMDRLDICPEKFHFWRPFPKWSELRIQWGKCYIRL